jgi:hypothetical protein
MKKKNSSNEKKLSLHKSIIYKLTSTDLDQIKGGDNAPLKPPTYGSVGNGCSLVGDK